jgi:hypothetical protein
MKGQEDNPPNPADAGEEAARIRQLQGGEEGGS